MHIDEIKSELDDFLKNGDKLEGTDFQPKSGEEPPKDLDKAVEMLKSFFATSYLGEWSVRDPLARFSLNPSLIHRNGIAGVSTLIHLIDGIQLKLTSLFKILLADIFESIVQINMWFRTCVNKNFIVTWFLGH